MKVSATRSRSATSVVVFVMCGVERKPNSHVYAPVYRTDGERGLFWRAQAIRHAEAQGARARFETPTGDRL